MSLIKTGDATILEVIKSDDLVTDKSTRQALIKAKNSVKKLPAEETVESNDSENQ